MPRSDRDAPGLSRRNFLRRVAAGAAGATLGGSLPGCGPERVGRPNVLLIVADDLGYEGLGCNGGTSYATPVVDGLAAGGLRFTEAYATPLCTPSRIQLMSGQYPFRTGFDDHMMNLRRLDRVVDPSVIDLAGMFKGAGYTTAVAGKWQLALFEEHPRHPSETGFDEYCLWTWDYRGQRDSFRRYWRPGVYQNGQINAEAHRDDVFGPDVFCDYLLDFMQRNRNLPFFAYYPAVLPHRPYVATPASGNDETDEFRLFVGMVEYLDRLVGRLVASLDAMDLREETLVIFTSDNGTPAEFTSFMGDVAVAGGKGLLTRAGAHVPLVANWPGVIAPGRVSDDLTDSTDLRPTLAQVAGVDPGRGRIQDGHGLMPVLRGEGRSPREWVYIQMGEARAIRDRRYKLFADERLIDLVNDPDESQPLTGDQGGDEAREARARLGLALAGLK